VSPQNTEADRLLAGVQAAVEETLGERVGTFKVAPVEGELGPVRQQARSVLSPEQRDTLEQTAGLIRAWLIERDPEAVERTRNRGYAPQDIDPAVSAGEDYVISVLLGENLDPTSAQILRRRLEEIRVETLVERSTGLRPKFELSNRSVQGIFAGLGVMVGGTGVGLVLGFASFPLMLGGATLVVISIRSWLTSDDTTRIHQMSTLQGGTFGRKKY
jgi:hypothetical protein